MREIVRLRSENLEVSEGEKELLSVLDDVSMAGSPIVVPVEVKGIAGEYGEGGYEVGLAGVALLTRMMMLAGRITRGEVKLDVN